MSMRSLKDEIDSLWAEALRRRTSREFDTALDTLSKIALLATDALFEQYTDIGYYPTVYIRDSVAIYEGFIRRQLNDISSAIDCYDKMLRLGDSSKATAYFYRAAANSSLGRLEAAAGDRQRFLESAIDEKWVGPWKALSLYSGLSRQDLACLVDDFNPTRASSVGEAATAYFCRAVCKGNYRVDRADASADYNVAFTLDLDNAALRFWREKIYSQHKIYSDQITPEDTDKMSHEMEYCNVACTLLPQANDKVYISIFSIDQPVEHSESDEGVASVLSNLESQGWSQKTGAWIVHSLISDYIFYYQRHKK